MTLYPTSYGYSGVAGVFQVFAENGSKMWLVAATPGEAVDAYISNQNPQFFSQELERITVGLVVPTEVLTSDSHAGASSGVSATAQAWATTYAAAVAAGASGANSSQGSQIVLVRTS